MLITVRGRLVRSHGSNDTALPGSGVIQYQPAAHGTHEGALRGVDPVPARITDGEAEPVELTPGPWRVSVFPEYGDAWEPYLVELTEDMDEPVDLADLAPVLAVDGERWATGPRGASVTGAVDNGDGTVSFTLSDGGTTEPVVMPPGPAGRGVESISDPDEDSLVTITYTDGSTSTVQAVRGRPGDPGLPGSPGEPGEDGRTPVIEWDGTALVIDGETGPDLQGPQGEGADVDWDTLDGKPSTFPPAAHTHPSSEVDGLQAALDDKTDTTDPRLSDARPPTTHTHPISDVTGLQAALPRIDTTAGTRVFAGDVMIHGETGWRDLTPYLAAGVNPSSSIPVARFRRVDDMVEFMMKVDLADDFTSKVICTFPTGFRSPGYRYLPGAYTAPTKGAGASAMVPVAMIGFISSAILQTPASNRLPSGSTLIWGGRFETNDSWPTVLPGDPA